jgi:hypothetical protein
MEKYPLPLIPNLACSQLGTQRTFAGVGQNDVPDLARNFRSYHIFNRAYWGSIQGNQPTENDESSGLDKLSTIAFRGENPKNTTEKKNKRREMIGWYKKMRKKAKLDKKLCIKM